MQLENLNDDNFLLYAAKHYDNAQCHDAEEFYDDLKRFKYLKRLFGKYKDTGELRERLILNHIIILYNVFGSAATRMLFAKLHMYKEYLKPFLVLLGHMPNKIENFDDKKTILYSSDIAMDEYIINVLRKI